MGDALGSTIRGSRSRGAAEGTLTWATPQMTLEDVMLSEVSPPHEDTHCTLTRVHTALRCPETAIQGWWPGPGEEGDGDSFSFAR